MGWLKRFIIRWLWGVREEEVKPHNCSELSIGMLRLACNELLDNFTSHAEQCWDTGKAESVKEVQLLASWFCQELQKAVGFPPTVN